MKSIDNSWHNIGSHYQLHLGLSNYHGTEPIFKGCHQVQLLWEAPTHLGCHKVEFQLCKPLSHASPGWQDWFNIFCEHFLLPFWQSCQDMERKRRVSWPINWMVRPLSPNLSKAKLHGRKGRRGRRRLRPCPIKAPVGCLEPAQG